ncbi:MAG: protein kinase [Myxococcales bacterium]|nr:protein kinase [Myxococcales bacterium]
MTPPDFPQGYTAERELGEGSMGTVWLARRDGGGHCAVKVLHLRNDRKGSAERSFNREVRAMARLDHPGIVAVHDYGRTPEGSPYVAMEYVSGAPLSAYVRGSWTWPRLWTLIDGLLSALGHAHARELVHRDLKPGNVLVLSDRVGPGAVKLADFGIALAVPDATRSGRRIEGTPAYIAPEAASGNVASVGPWTDLYSLGVMLFEIVTGDLPYHGRHLLTHHQRSPLPPVIVRDAVSVPPGLVAVIERLLAKSPMKRFRSVAGVRRALMALGAPERPEPLGVPQRRLFEERAADVATTLRPLDGAAGPALFHLREPHLVGREDAQRVLLDAAEKVIAGEGPRVVIIEGEAGLGKSRLAGWLRELMEESGRMRTLVVRSEPQTYSGGGLRQAVLRFIGAPTATRDEAAGVFDEAFSAADLRENALEVLWSQAPHTGPASEVHIRRAADLVASIAGEIPFLLWADDAQWSPEGKVLRLVHRLGRPDGPKNLLLVVTLRPSERTTVLAARKAVLKLPGADHLRLGPVNPMLLAPALEALAPLEPGLAEGACIAAAGNPLIALEAVRGYLETHGLGSAPADPQTVLRQRIERATAGPLGGELRSACARATLLGRSFNLKPLVELCAVPGEPDAPALTGDSELIETLLERAVDAGLVVEQGPRKWRFSHDLVRAQLRQTCRELPNWSQLNLTAARLRSKRAELDPTGIELEVVARHCWEGGQTERALKLGREGLTRLYSSGLMGHATAFARRLLDWDERVQGLGPAERGEVRLMASEAAEHSGQPDEAERHALAAVEIARRNELAALGARAASRVGVLKLHHDDDAQAEEWLMDALRFARASGEPRALADAELSLGRFYQHREAYNMARTAYDQSLEAANDAGMLVQRIAARSGLARIHRLIGQVDRAESTFTRLADEAQEAGLEVAAIEARLQLGLCAWTRDDAAGARDAFSEVRHGSRGNLFVMEFIACIGEAWAFAADGRWTDAEIALLHAEDLRYDVRLRDAEAERLRRDLRDLAEEAGRPDLVDRVDKLDVIGTRTGSTHHSR